MLYTVMFTVVVEAGDPRDAARIAHTALKTDAAPDAAYIVIETDGKEAKFEDTGAVHMLS